MVSGFTDCIVDMVPPSEGEKMQKCLKCQVVSNDKYFTDLDYVIFNESTGGT